MVDAEPIVRVPSVSTYRTVPPAPTWKVPPAATIFAPRKVAIPDTLTSSSSVWPSTSNAPLASMAPLNLAVPAKVDAPDTLTSSN